MVTNQKGLEIKAQKSKHNCIKRSTVALNRSISMPYLTFRCGKMRIYGHSFSFELNQPGLTPYVTNKRLLVLELSLLKTRL